MGQGRIIDIVVMKISNFIEELNLEFKIRVESLLYNAKVRIRPELVQLVKWYIGRNFKEVLVLIIKESVYIKRVKICIPTSLHFI